MTRSTVALVGRPNVGKSTLFNRLAGGKRAIVDPKPGVTRDRNFAETDWNGHRFWIVDTGGWTTIRTDTLNESIRTQVTRAVEEADIVAFVVDTLEGVHPADLEVAELLRPLSDRVIVVANKTDDLPDDSSYYAFHELGLGDPQPVSAATGKGSGDLLDRLITLLPVTSGANEDTLVNIAIVGRPNVGKSSITNRLLGSDRSIVDVNAGTTRDAVDSPLRYHGRTLNFIDTAGLRKRLKVKDDIEFYSTLRTQRAIARSDVCVLTVDAVEGIHTQDIKIAQAAWERGAGLVIAVNKWDLIEGKDSGTGERGRRAAITKAPFLGHVPFTYVSATTGLRIHGLLDMIMKVWETRLKRIPTAAVNVVIEDLVDHRQPPQTRGRDVRLLYGSQVAVAPPTFAIVTNRPKDVPETYQRYLLNGFYRAWPFEGTPLRLRLRSRKGRR